MELGDRIFIFFLKVFYVLLWHTLQSLLGCFHSLFHLAAPFVPHEPPCVVFFPCTGGAPSPKAAFGVVKKRLRIWEECLKHLMDVYKRVMLAARLGRSTLKEHLQFYLGERQPNWAVRVCRRIPGVPALKL